MRTLCVPVLCGAALAALACTARPEAAEKPVKPRFTDVTAGAGLKSAADTRVGGANPPAGADEDFDGDGRPDLFVTCPDGANSLFRNNGDGTFTDIAKEAGVDMAGRHSLGCAFGDVDGDGRDDLFVTAYQSQVSALFRNLGGGTFKD